MFLLPVYWFSEFLCIVFQVYVAAAFTINCGFKYIQFHWWDLVEILFVLLFLYSVRKRHYSPLFVRPFVFFKDVKFWGNLFSVFYIYFIPYRENAHSSDTSDYIYTSFFEKGWFETKGNTVWQKKKTFFNNLDFWRLESKHVTLVIQFIYLLINLR